MLPETADNHGVRRDAAGKNAACSTYPRKLEGLEPSYAISGNDETRNKGASGYRLPTEAEWDGCPVCALRGGPCS